MTIQLWPPPEHADDCSGPSPHGHGDVANIDAACRADIERIAAVGAGIDIFRERSALGREILQMWLIGGGKCAGEADAEDRHALITFCQIIETERAMSTRESGEIFHPLDQTAHQRDVAIELARRLTDNDIKFRPCAGIRRKITPDTHHAVAMGGPDRQRFSLGT